MQAEHSKDAQELISKKRDVKVLISADINGRFETVIPKISQLHSKNNFDFMLLLGNVCHPRASPFINNIAKGQNNLPLNMYFIDNSDFSPVLHKLHPNGKQIVPKFQYLGKKGVIQLCGLKIAYFNCYDKKKDANYFEAQVEEFLRSCQGKNIDILLTNEWPQQIKIISQKQSVISADYCSKLVDKICPRYHLAAGCQSFYRMTPYKNSKGTSTHFICVAPCEQQLKDKYLFAVTIKPSQIEQVSEGDQGFLQNPYQKEQLKKGDQKISLKQRVFEKKKGRQQPKGQIIVFFESFPDWARRQDISDFLQRWGEIKHLDSYKDKRGGYSGTVRFSQEQSTKKCIEDSGKFMFHSTRIKFQARSLRERLRIEDCWFCKINADRSLMIWQGKYMYISVEKGPLCKYHIQIIPFNHTQCSTQLDPQQQKQLNMIKTRLKSHFSQQGYQVIVYQRYLGLSEAVNHCVVHMLPVKSVQSYNRIFQKLNKDDDLRFKQWNGGRRTSQYFLLLQIGNKSYLRQVQRKQRVQADYMRQIICQMFQTPKLVHWKACVRTNEQLTAQKSNLSSELTKAGLMIATE